jgi:hypothetical protein
MFLQAVSLITGIPGPARREPSTYSRFSEVIGAGGNYPIEFSQNMYIELK